MKCYLCGKISKMGGKRKKLRGNYNPTVKSRKYPNLQWVRFSNGKRAKACRTCAKTLVKKS